MKLFWCAALAAGALSAQSFSGAAALDEVINQAIVQGRMPGAVLLVGHEGKVVYRKAYGKRALVPRPEAMTLDTVFDCASLTKVLATTSSLMKLFEEGRFRLSDKITDYIPEFQGGQSEITLRELFTHFSGLRMIARARTARCFWPPERSLGYLRRNRSTGTRPTRSRDSDTRRRISASPLAMWWIRNGWPTGSGSGIAGLSDACGSWKMSWSRLRSGRNCRSDSPEIVSPFNAIDPPVTLTRESTARESVVLPLPDPPT